MDMVERVRTWLGFPAAEVDRIAVLDGPTGSFSLPTGDELRGVLDRLHVPHDALDEIVAAAPDPERDPEAWWLLDRLHAQVVADDGLEPPWPAPFPDDGALAHHFHLYVFAAATDAVLARHAARGIDPDTTWATLRDVGLQVANYHVRHGRSGFDGAWWIWPHFRGEVFRLGRLQYDLRTVVFDPPPDAGFERDDPALGVHIPAYGPLDPDACDESFDRAVAFFAEHFADRPFATATCESWLLDPQLAAYLPATSNIVRFQRRFSIAPGWSKPGDETVQRFVFGSLPASIDELPSRTTLERAVADHIRSGRHWEVRVGWLPWFTGRREGR